MPRRGGKRDAEATAKREPKFKDKRSFVNTEGHEFLFGRDMGIRRREVYARDGGRCATCGEKDKWLRGEMDHIVPRSKGGCDCLHNLRWLHSGIYGGCPAPHRGKGGRHA